MPEFGLMGVDWEERIDFPRMRRERLAKAKEALAKTDVNALLVLRHEDVRYLTSFRSHMRPVAAPLGFATAVLPRGGDPILYTVDHVSAAGRMPWMPKGTIQTAGNFRAPTGVKAWGERVKATIGNLAEGTIGVDLLTVTILKALQEAFPKAEFVDGAEVLAQAKITKTRDELECLRAACMITEAGMAAALRILKPGMKECELLAEAWRTFTALGSEWSQCANVVCSGPHLAPYRRITSDRVIREGDLVAMDIGCCFNGYWGDFTRTYICGDILPTREQKMLHQECYDSVFAGCDAARPGNTNADIHKAIQNKNSQGLSGGHSSGVNPWEPPFVTGYSPETTITLKPGMVVNIEPYAGIAGVGGVRLENNVIVTEGAPDIYSTYPFDERLLDDIHPLDKTTGRRHLR
ncbi:MAG: aminopeptidase P family protein [Chloroflexi bacterium]|nr:aminopeptidase P family protein [Chloroflexota bacterium]